MKSIFFLLVVGVFFASEGWSNRGLPTGEESPQVIEKIYESPRGEVHFAKSKDSHLVLLRNPSGLLLELSEIKGPADCEGWILSKKNADLPRGCDFFFYDESNGTYLSVRSEEMSESSIFQSVRKTLRESGRYVTL
ncbi:MAG: hypothetical protein M9962_03905 [Oligoflexia bacterium]|nr:hypothetical protein [Oligoflexia bacterium]